ncbi:ATP/GTP-binding protein, partial [Streptomyces sp. NPDC002920]
MASAPSSTTSRPAHDGIHLPDTARDLVKILVAGPFGVGKTTLIDSVSEIRPLHTEEHLSEASAGVDDLAGVRDKSTTTVAVDFGRLSLPGGVARHRRLPGRLQGPAQRAQEPLRPPPRARH